MYNLTIDLTEEEVETLRSALLNANVDLYCKVYPALIEKPDHQQLYAVARTGHNVMMRGWELRKDWEDWDMVGKPLDASEWLPAGYHFQSSIDSKIPAFKTPVSAAVLR